MKRSQVAQIIWSPCLNSQIPRALETYISLKVGLCTSPTARTGEGWHPENRRAHSWGSAISPSNIRRYHGICILDQLLLTIKGRGHNSRGNSPVSSQKHRKKPGLLDPWIEWHGKICVFPLSSKDLSHKLDLENRLYSSTVQLRCRHVAGSCPSAS